MGTTPQIQSSLTDLCALAEKFGTDKLGVYTPFYDLLFAARRCNIFKVLEVGIGTPEAMQHVKGYVPGASLRMWKEYFPHADIVGLDVNPAAVESAARERIQTFQCDQASEAELEAMLPKLILGGRFDLIVDDGSHKPEDQLLTFKMLSRLLAPHGLYIIEDVNRSIVFPEGTVPYLSDATVVEHFHGDGHSPGRCILIRGEAIQRLTYPIHPTQNFGNVNGGLLGL